MRFKQFDDRGSVRGIDVFSEDAPGDGAIHGTGVHHDEAEAFGEFAGERAFAGGGGSVDGDGEMFWVAHARETVGRMKSAASVRSSRIASRWWENPG